MTSPVQPGFYVYPEQFPITYTCITRGSRFVEWKYNDNENHVSLTADHHIGKSVPDGSNHFNTTLINIDTNTGQTIIISELSLYEMEGHNEIIITCINGDLRESTNITLYKSGEPPTSYTHQPQ